MDKQKINDLEQKVILPKPIGCLLLLIGLGVFFLIGKFFLSIGIEMYKDAPIWGRLIFRVFILLSICFMVLKIEKEISLDKAIKSGIAVRKEAKIINFVYKKGGESSENGYYVILSDGEKKYNSSFYEGARVIGKKTERELYEDEFYEKNGITLDLKNRDITKRQLDQKISDLELQKTDVNLFKRLKIDLKIGSMRRKREDLEPYHLHTREGDLYIGDTGRVLIDPDDSNNYTVEFDIEK